MQIRVSREALLKPLQITSGVVDRKQTMPILGNLLLVSDKERLSVTATDLEIEMVAYAPLEGAEHGSVTVPAKKFADIWRSLPEGAAVQLTINNERAELRSGKSRFVLSTLPAEGFPSVEALTDGIQFQVPQRALKTLIDQTQFAMAQQDVRYYLNGLLLDVGPELLRAVATDGHRLALCERAESIKIKENQQVIIPRKGVIELMRLLEDSDAAVTVQIGANHIRVTGADYSFTSKLVDGRFPDYQRVVPQGGDKVVVGDREQLRQALSRISILCNERYRSVRFQLEPGTLRIFANNPEQEEAEEEIAVDYNGGQLQIGFNASYILEALSAVRENDVRIVMSDPNSCCLIRGLNDDSSKYVVMPMRL